jgi:hypothetical protein
MAKKQNNDYHYTAGTINEQLDSWSIYEDDGNLVLFDGSNEVSFSGLTLGLAAPRTSHPTTDELGAGEGAVYFFDDESGTISLFAAYNDDGSVETASAADVVTPA